MKTRPIRISGRGPVRALLRGAAARQKYDGLYYRRNSFFFRNTNFVQKLHDTMFRYLFHLWISFSLNE